MLKKLFGGKDNFYIQLDENTAPTSEARTDVKPEPVAAAKETPPPADSPKMPVNKPAKAEKSTPAIKVDPVAVVPTPPKPQLDPAQVAFASADPIPQTIARRTAGPSLNKFKDMARQVVKTR